MRNINLVVSMFILFHVFEAFAQKQVVKIPISMAAESKKLELSRVINVERMVILETTTKNLLPDQFIIVPMMKGLIIIDGSRSIQSYSSTGKFIRTLSVRGNGPNEFSMISSYCTDQKNNIFYYCDAKSPSMIRAIDITTGAQLKDIILPLDQISGGKNFPGLKNLVLLNDRTFVCASKSFDGMIYPVFLISSSGKFIKGFPFTNGENLTSFNSSLSKFNNVARYLVNGKKEFSNLMYSVADKMVPYGMFDIEAIQAKGSIYQISLSINAEGLNSMMAQVTVGFMETQDPTMITLHKNMHYIDKKANASFPISSLKIDYLGDIEMIPYLFTNDNLAAVEVNAVDIRKYAKDILKTDGLNSGIRLRLEKLLNDTTDEDNPIVLIGSLK